MNTLGSMTAIRTQAEVARLLDISRIRVYQIEQKAMKKLRRDPELRGLLADLTELRATEDRSSAWSDFNAAE